MARPAKQGLNYFPLDVDFFEDIKIRKLQKACGVQSIPVFIYILCNVYRNDGYYCGIGEDETFLIAERFGVSEGVISEIVKKSVSVGLFDRRMFDQYQILTSRAIQERFFKACLDCKKKSVRVTGDFLLISVIPELMAVSSGIMGVNSGRNPTKKSKVKKSKVKKRNTSLCETPCVSPKEAAAPLTSLTESIKKKIIEEWNEIKELNKIKNLNGTTRQRHLKARINEYGLETIYQAIEKVSKSDFLKGNNNRQWKATFDWIIQQSNFTKILEGNYDNRNSGNSDSNGNPQSNNQENQKQSDPYSHLYANL